MKGYLIKIDDANLCCTVTVVDVREDEDGPEYAHMLELLGASGIDHTSTYGEGALAGHCGYVDGYGLMNAHQGYVLCPDLHPLPLAAPILLLGEVMSRGGEITTVSATIDEGVVRGLFEKAYVNRNYARAAHSMSEMKTKANNPDAIVMPVSRDM